MKNYFIMGSVIASVLLMVLFDYDDIITLMSCMFFYFPFLSIVLFIAAKVYKLKTGFIHLVLYMITSNILFGGILLIDIQLVNILPGFTSGLGIRTLSAFSLGTFAVLYYLLSIYCLNIKISSKIITAIFVLGWAAGIFSYKDLNIAIISGSVLTGIALDYTMYSVRQVQEELSFVGLFRLSD
jgi:hypothetical protein